MKKLLILLVTLLLVSTSAFAGEYLGNLSANPYNPDSISNPYGA